MDINTLTASRIKEIRMSLGLKAESVAQDLEMDKGSYSNLENGKSQVSIDKLFRISKIFGVPFITLVPTQMSQQQMVNINHGENPVFNGTQINHYNQIVSDLEKSAETSLKAAEYIKKGR